MEYWFECLRRSGASFVVLSQRKKCRILFEPSTLVSFIERLTKKMSGVFSTTIQRRLWVCPGRLTMTEKTSFELSSCWLHMKPS